MGQAAVTQRRGGQPGGGAAECRTVASSHAEALPEADAAPPHTEPVGDGIPEPDRRAAPDRDAAADRRADVRVTDGHRHGAHPLGEHLGNRLTGARAFSGFKEI